MQRDRILGQGSVTPTLPSRGALVPFEAFAQRRLFFGWFDDIVFNYV